MTDTPRFLGRRTELDELKRQAQKQIASLIVVKGRRRIGKSRLIEEFGQDCRFYTFAGLAPNKKTTKQSQLDEFANQLGLAFGMPGIGAYDWNALFLLLARQVEGGRVIILLDEISWMGSKDSDFLEKLKNAWDLYFKKNPNLTLVICSSASAWVEQNILSSTAFMGRVSYTLTLDELPLVDCNEFWANAGGEFSAYEKFKVLAITGGIPRYLEEIQPKYSAEENIRSLCFNPGGFLTNEFNKIFTDLFGKRGAKYKEIVRLLVQGSLEYKEICEQLDVASSGVISEYLNNLVLSGFISRDNTWDPKTGISAPLLFKYRLRDNYLRFYLKYIEKRFPEIERGIYQFKSLESLPGWASIMGLQFENLVLNNRSFIHTCLRISPEDIVTENPFFQHKTTRQPGCQIDYMIQTRTNLLYVCEIKFSRNVVGADVIAEMREKVSRLSLPRGMSCCPVLIHVNGVTDAVVDANYFSEIINFSKILQPSN